MKALFRLGALLAAIAAPGAATAACRITDFTGKTLSALNEVERLSLAAQMTQVEYEKLHALRPGDPNYVALIAENGTAAEARRAALDKLYSLNVENIDGYRAVWATDFLTDTELQKYTNCLSQRAPGLTVAGRFEKPGEFHLTYTHLTPIGIEKITTKVIASSNIANIKALEASLAQLGPQDNYDARTFALRLEDPGKAAVLVLRGGWETPKFIYIPVFPTPSYFK